jgi:hypothetical protein
LSGSRVSVLDDDRLALLLDVDSVCASTARRRSGLAFLARAESRRRAARAWCCRALREGVAADARRSPPPPACRHRLERHQNGAAIDGGVCDTARRRFSTTRERPPACTTLTLRALALRELDTVLAEDG